MNDDQHHRAPVRAPGGGFVELSRALADAELRCSMEIHCTHERHTAVLRLDDAEAGALAAVIGQVISNAPIAPLGAP